MPPVMATRATARADPARHADTGLRELAATLLLAHGPDAAPDANALIETHGSATQALLRRRLMAAPQTSLFADPERELERELEHAEREIAWWRAQGIQLLAVNQPQYPVTLRAAPPLLFVAGRLKPADLEGVAIIGSRPPAARAGNAGGRGAGAGEAPGPAARPDQAPGREACAGPPPDRAELRLAAELAAALAERRRTVLSGLATGIDTAAHTAALKRGGRTIAVVGTGLSRCYPRDNVILQRRIAAQCAVISPFHPDTTPSAATFPIRDALLIDLAAATVIVAVTATSELRARAQMTVAQNKPLILLAPLLRHRWAREVADHAGVYIAETVDDILAGLQP